MLAVAWKLKNVPTSPLALVLPVWAASLIVGILITAVGGGFAWSALRRLSLKTLTPDRMTASMRKDTHVLKKHI